MTDHFDFTPSRQNDAENQTNEHARPDAVPVDPAPFVDAFVF